MNNAILVATQHLKREDFKLLRCVRVVTPRRKVRRFCDVEKVLEKTQLVEVSPIMFYSSTICVPHLQGLQYGSARLVNCWLQKVH